jgi:hypothetical protein
MASLEDLSKRLGIDLKPSNNKVGRKRRSWLIDETNGESDNQSTKGLQIGDNQSTKGLQTGDNQSTKGLQTGDNQSTKGLQIGDNQSTKGLQTGDNQSTKGLQTGDNQSTKGLQIGDNQSTENTDYVYNELTGIQKKIVEYMYKACLDSRSRITKKINILDIQSSLGIGESSAKTSILRLKNKNCILIHSRKNGRGGWCKYEIEKTLFQSIVKSLYSIERTEDTPSIYNSNTTNTINKSNNPTTEQKPTATQNDQLVELIKKQNDQFQQQIADLQKQFLQPQLTAKSEKKLVTVTEGAEATSQDNDLENWSDLDYSSLVEFGFTQRHVSQIKNFNKILDADNQLSVDCVQESIEHYAWALRNRLDEMKSYAPDNNRLRGLLGVLKKGGNWTEANYKSPEDLAFEVSLKAKKERLEKIKAQKEEVFNIEFDLWREGLTESERAEIEEKGELHGKMSPSAFKNKGDNKLYVAALKSYFKNNVYRG